MANEDVIHTGPMHGILLISTASTAQGWVFENELPTISAYCGYKIPSGEYVYDETVHKYPIIAVEDKGDLISAGNWSTRYASWSKMGYNPDVNNTEECLNYIGGMPVWAATSGVPMKVVSGNNGDKSGSTTGCTKMWVKYLGSDYLEYSTIVTLNGTTAVALVDTSIARIQNFQAYEGLAPLGDVFIYPSTASTMYISQCPAGLTRARNSMYTVPLNKTLYIKTQYYSAAMKGTAIPVRFLLKSNYNENQSRYSTSLFWPIGVSLLKDTGTFSLLPLPLKIPQKTDIYVSSYTTGTAGTQQSESMLRGWTVENT